MQGSAAVSSLSEISSPTDNSEDKSFKERTVLDVVNMEKLFLVGALDELKIRFSCSYQVGVSIVSNFSMKTS